MKQNETSKPCRDHEIDRAFGSRDTSRVAIQPEDGIVALAEWGGASWTQDQIVPPGFQIAPPIW